MYRCTICDCQFSTNNDSIIENLLITFLFDMIVVHYRPRCFIGHLYLILRLSDTLYSHGRQKARSARYVPRIRVKSYAYTYSCRRRAYLNRKIGMILYYISLIKYAVERRRRIGTILTFRPAHAIVHSSRII